MNHRALQAEVYGPHRIHKRNLYHWDGLMKLNRQNAHSRSANMVKWERHNMSNGDLVLFMHLYASY